MVTKINRMELHTVKTNALTLRPGDIREDHHPFYFLEIFVI